MNLTSEDLRQIRLIMREEAKSVVDNSLNERLLPIENEVKALRNDVTEIYDMITDISRPVRSN